MAVRSSLKDMFKRREISYHHFLYQGSIVFLLARTGDDFANILDEALIEAVQTARMYHGIRIDIGVSADFRGFRELRGAYLEARRALDYSQFLNQGRIAYIRDIEKVPIRSLAMSGESLKAVEHALRFGSDSELRTVIARERDIVESSGDRPADYRLYMLNLVNIAVNFASSTGADITAENQSDIFETISGFGGPDQMFDWFETIVARLRDANLKIRMSNSQLSLETAISYMKANFADPKLSLEVTCDNVGISVSYLSLLFKKNTGQTFVKYLTALRMDKARELLKYSGNRIIEIAEKCGYKDVYYFSHSFKKHEGISPKQYRADQTTN